MNRRPRPRKRLHTVVFVVLFVVAVGGTSIAAKQYLEGETTISATPEARVTRVLGAKAKTRTFTSGPFSIDLPKDWEQYTSAGQPAGTINWRNTDGNKGVRVISLYPSGPPADIAVNRVLAVQGVGDHLTIQGSVSDNCTEFSDKGREPTGGTGRASARWQGVQFTCDTANYVRNVVGISSTDGPNRVKLNGASGSHTIFITYNDADASPNFSTFTSALETLRVK